MREEERSPCIQCDRLEQAKNKCAESCEKLEIYQERLPHFTLWRGGSTYYSMPGLQRTPSYRTME